MSARILIVDDDRDNRELLEIILTREGFEILTAAGGVEALVATAQGPRPDLILLDVMMPGMTGYEVAAKLKGDLATKSIPIIMVTALDDHRTRMLARSAGAADLLSKPVASAALCASVRKLLPSG
jgi:two-component system cell cycle response regulator